MSINATLFLQAIVFAILVWFTMKFVWPPIAKALDERTQKIADGLAQADQARYELESAHKKAEAELSTSRNETAVILADAERRAASIIAEAKGKAEIEAGRIIESAKVEAQLQVIQLRAALRVDVAKLAVQGAEKILRREINPSAHAELISQLQEDL